eukprot:14847375-Alexandrium_andersonii.AAC.1
MIPPAMWGFVLDLLGFRSLRARCPRRGAQDTPARRRKLLLPRLFQRQSGSAGAPVTPATCASAVILERGRPSPGRRCTCARIALG